MPQFPVAIQQYFEALSYGLEAVFPPCRIKNRAFLLTLYEALQQEPTVTVLDLEHLKTLMAMADKVVFPSIADVKSCCEVEAFLIQACPQFPKKQVRLTLQWALLLLARHGLVEVELSKVEVWFRIWRWIQTFHPIEQGFLSDAIAWLTSKSFSPRSILDIVREYKRLNVWMKEQQLKSLRQVGDLELQRYILDRACGQRNASKQKILGKLRPLFYYYQEAIDGGYQVPIYTVAAPRSFGVSTSATSQEVQKVWRAIRANQLPIEPAFMLFLILGYGLPLKTLPLLRLTKEPGKLVYEQQLPCRRGIQEQWVSLSLQEPWLAHLWERYLDKREIPSDYPYLFVSGHGSRRKRPVSVEYCQRQVQEAVQEILGYPIPINALERGAVKRMAESSDLPLFMELTHLVPKTRQTRMMYWLASKPSFVG